MVESPGNDESACQRAKPNAHEPVSEPTLYRDIVHEHSAPGILYQLQPVCLSASCSPDSAQWHALYALHPRTMLLSTVTPAACNGRKALIDTCHTSISINHVCCSRWPQQCLLFTAVQQCSSCMHVCRHGPALCPARPSPQERVTYSGERCMHTWHVERPEAFACESGVPGRWRCLLPGLWRPELKLSHTACCHCYMQCTQ